MKKLLIVLAIVALVLAGCASMPRQPWTNVDKAMFAAAVAAQGYDYKTTDDYIESGGKMRSEWRWLYGGARPSSSTLAISKAAQLGLAWAVLDRVKSRYRKIVLGIMTGTWVWYGRQNKEKEKSE